MGAIAIDVNDMVQINAAAFRVLSDNLGDDATRAFINQFKYSSGHAVTSRPRITAAQIATILEQARAKAEAGRGKGEGDYTAEKKNRPKMTFEESIAGIMDAEKRELTRRGMAL